MLSVRPRLPLRASMILIAALVGPPMAIPREAGEHYEGKPILNIRYDVRGTCYKQCYRTNMLKAYDLIETKATRMPWYSPDEYSYPLAAEGKARIIQAGRKIRAGGHGQFQGLSFHWNSGRWGRER